MGRAVPLEDYRSVPRKQRKKCVRCKRWFPRTGETAGFGKGTCSDGLQSICHLCKHIRSKERRDQKPAQRLRHHFSTRIDSQLGWRAPKDIRTNLEGYIGYKFRSLASYLARDLKEREGSHMRLRDVLVDGKYHVDHIHPLREFKVVRDDDTIDWEEFRRCWAMENLSAIPAEANLKKGTKILGGDVDVEAVARTQS